MLGLFRGAVAAAVALLGTSSAVMADEVADPIARAPYYETLANKRVVFVPITARADLTRAWISVMTKNMKEAGVNFEVRDANFNPDDGVRIISGLISEKPDLMIIQPFDVQLYVRLEKQAQAAGIKVMEVNLPSVGKPDAYVGVDWVKMGEQMGDYIVKQCADGKGPSTKVAFIGGLPTSANDLYQKKGMDNVFAKHPGFEFVSVQYSQWDPSKSRSIMDTVLQQHKDLCAAVGIWDGADVGIGAAVEAAGLKGKVTVVTSGAGENADCDNLKRGIFSAVINYDAVLQGDLLAQKTIDMLLSPIGVGEQFSNYYTPLHTLTAENMTAGSCYALDKLP